MSRENNTYALFTFVAGMMVTVCAMILAVFIAVQKPVVVVVPLSPGAAPTQGAAPSAVASTPTGGAAATPQPATPVELTAGRIPAVPASANPFDPAWDRVPGKDIPLQPQAITMPILETPSVSSVTVQAVHDNNRIAFRLSWAAPNPSANVDADRFTDAAAIQFAQDPATPFMMGGPGKPVRILQWKALWQKDLDEGFQDVQNLHPNFWADAYWFAEGNFPFPVTESFKDPVARQWLIGLQSGNPMSDIQRKQPVEEIVAEGFGTATHVADTASSAKGVWKNGRWTVVIDRPYAPDDPLASSLQASKSAIVSLAVWDGSAANVGGRKHYCTWVPLKVEP